MFPSVCGQGKSPFCSFWAVLGHLALKLLPVPIQFPEPGCLSSCFQGYLLLLLLSKASSSLEGRKELIKAKSSSSSEALGLLCSFCVNTYSHPHLSSLTSLSQPPGWEEGKSNLKVCCCCCWFWHVKSGALLNSTFDNILNPRPNCRSRISLVLVLCPTDPHVFHSLVLFSKWIYRGAWLLYSFEDVTLDLRVFKPHVWCRTY